MKTTTWKTAVALIILINLKPRKKNSNPVANKKNGTFVWCALAKTDIAPKNGGFQ